MFRGDVMKKRKFIYLVVFLLIVGYILIDTGVGSTEAKEDVKDWSSIVDGEASYTENVSLDQVIKGNNQITLYVTEIVYFPGVIVLGIFKTA